MEWASVHPPLKQVSVYNSSGGTPQGVPTLTPTSPPGALYTASPSRGMTLPLRHG